MHPHLGVSSIVGILLYIWEPITALNYIVLSRRSVAIPSSPRTVNLSPDIFSQAASNAIRMKTWCECFKALCRKWKSRVSPEAEYEVKDTHKPTTEMRVDAHNLSMTVLSEDHITPPQQKCSGGAPSPPRTRPKVYKVVQGGSSICHTPTLDKSPLTFGVKQKKFVIRKGEPSSALLVADLTAKKTLRQMKHGRSYSEDEGKPGQPNSNL